MSRIVFRADASIRIGTGHVMRCLALADVLRGQGDEIEFICREDSGDLCRLIQAGGFAVHRLPAGVDLPNGWLEDASATQHAIAEVATDWVVVDHYALDVRWEAQMRGVVGKLMVIDDLANRPHDCDLLLDQNLSSHMEERYEEKTPSTCTKLLGPRYALLRAEFGETRKKSRIRDGSVKRVLIFFGGSDPTNETAKALLAVQQLHRPDIAVDVIVGASNPRCREIEEWCGLLPSVSFHCQAKNMAELMLAADLSIGAGGSASWERCCLGLPSIVISVAVNQDAVAQALADGGFIRFLGRSADVSAEDLARSLREMLANEENIRAMAERANMLVDGDGAWRVATALHRLEEGARNDDTIQLRYAGQQDERRLFEWRNALEVRVSSFDSNEISFEDHRRWFGASLGNPARHLLIGEVENQSVGVLRYDVVKDTAEVSIYLVPGLSGKGIGTRLLMAGRSWLQRNLPAVRKVRARIRPSNMASRRAFAKAGFIPFGEDYILDLGRN